MKRSQPWLCPIIFTAFCLFCLSCGYRPGLGSTELKRQGICVPFVSGDRDGRFTSELIRQLALSGIYYYTSDCPDLILKVCMHDCMHESIGYRYETSQTGEIGKRLVASEDRAHLSTEITLLDAQTNRVVLGPVCLQTSLDYDYIPETSAQIFGLPAQAQTLTRFSLGQLDFRDAAGDAAKTPLYRKMAKQIIDYISETW